MSYIDEQDYQNDTFEENNFQKEECPTFLLVLCILTFIGSGFNLLMNTIISAAYTQIPDMLSNLADVYEQMGMDVDTILKSFMPKSVYLLTCLCSAASIVGAAFMLSLRRIGFHIYTIAQLCLFAIPALIAHVPNFFGLIVTLFFVTMYATFLKKMY